MRRILFHISWIAFAFGAACLFSLTAYPFHGELLVHLGTGEDVALRPKGGWPTLGAFPASSLATPPQGLSPIEEYSALRLPFTVHLKESTVLAQLPPVETLRIETGSEQREIPVSAGASVDAGGGSLRMGTARPWTGLLRHATGTPMAAVTLRDIDGKWGERVLLRPGSVQRIGDVAIYLRWAVDLEGAEALLPEHLDVWQGARWGVTEGGRTHWFQTFQPGSGVTLDDNTQVSLLRVFQSETGQPAIEISLRNAQGSTSETIHAGGRGQVASLECPLAAESVLMLAGWGDTQLCAAWYTGMERSANTRLVPGLPWDLESASLQSVRLDQVMAQAIPVSAEQAAVWALPLEGSALSIELREGSTETLESSRLTYRRLPQPGQLRHVLELRDSAGRLLDAFDLAPGAEHRFGNWKLRQASSGAGGVGGAVLDVERYTPWEWWAAVGAVMAISLGCAAARRRC